MVAWDYDPPPEVNEGPAYTILHEARMSAACYGVPFDLAGVDSETRRSLLALTEYFAFAFNFYLDRGMAKGLPDWRAAFTPEVLSLN